MLDKLREYLSRIDSLWAEGEVLAHELLKSQDEDEQKAGKALLSYWDEWRELTLQAGIIDEEVTGDPPHGTS